MFHELEWLDVSILGMVPLFASSGIIWSMLSTEWGLLDHGIFVYMYMYRHIILYTFKSSFILANLFINTLVYLNLTIEFTSYFAQSTKWGLLDHGYGW